MRSQPGCTHRNFVNGLSFHPNSSLLLSASDDHTVRISSVPGGDPVVRVVPHNDAVNRCVWSPDGATFATVDRTGPLVRVWKFDGSRSKDFSIPIATANSFIKLSADGKYLLSSGLDVARDRSSLQVHEAQTGGAVGERLQLPGFISDATFVSGSRLVVLAGGADRDEDADSRRQNLDRPGTAGFFYFDSGKEAFARVPTPSQPVAVEGSPDGRTVVVLCNRGQVLLFDAITGKLRREYQGFDGAAAMHGVVIRDRIRFSPKGGWSL